MCRYKWLFPSSLLQKRFHVLKLRLANRPVLLPLIQQVSQACNDVVVVAARSEIRALFTVNQHHEDLKHPGLRNDSQYFLPVLLGL